MRDDSTSNTRDVTTQERDTSLLETIVRFLRLAEGFVDLRYSRLESRELDHGVGDLARPQRVQTLVQPANTLFLDDLTPPFSQRIGERRHCGLHADLDGFERAQRNVGKEFGGGGRSEEDDGLGGVRRELLAIQILEDFVEPVLAGTLQRVTDEGRRPTEEDAAQALFRVDHLPSFGVRLVELCVYLATTFHLENISMKSFQVRREPCPVHQLSTQRTHQIKRCDHGVCRSTRYDTTDRACCKVIARVKLNLLLGLQLAEFVCHCVVCEVSLAAYRGDGVVSLIMTSRAACGASRSCRKQKSKGKQGIKCTGS